MKTKPKQLTALEALEEAIRITGAQEKRRDNEFTAQEYAERAGTGIHAARRMLTSAVKDGKLAVRKTTRNFYYSIP
jgi:hypothetical protein